MGMTSALLSYLLAALVAGASLAGVAARSVYALEKPLWAAQGVGQDFANLGVVLPTLIVATQLAQKGSARALLVWAGVLLYLVYSYLLYAFFVHFGPLFPVYVAILGLAFYLFCASLLGVDLERAARSFADRTPIRLAAGLLIACGAAFFALWGSEVLRALLDGTPPAGVVESGLPVNPVHVLDLALLLPGLVLTGILLLRGRPLGYFLAPVLLVTLVMLGCAVLAMAVVMILRGFPPPLAMMATVGSTTVLSGAVAGLFLFGLRQ